MMRRTAAGKFLMAQQVNGAGQLALALPASGGLDGRSLRAAIIGLEATLVAATMWALDLLPPLAFTQQPRTVDRLSTLILVCLVFAAVKQLALGRGLGALADLRSIIRSNTLAMLACLVLVLGCSNLAGANSSFPTVPALVLTALALVALTGIDHLMARQVLIPLKAAVSHEYRRVALLGSVSACAVLESQLRGMGCFSIFRHFDPCGDDHVEATRDLQDLVKQGGLDEVIVVLEGTPAPQVLRCIEVLLQYPVDLSCCQPQLADIVGQIAAHRLPLVLPLVRQPDRGIGAVAKRVIDITFSCAALTLLLPLFLSVALVIKVESPGPIFFRQVRAGYGQRRFSVYKFRTMFHGVDRDGFRQATRGDVRITRVGSFLRSWSVDELPQLINVLRGEMSLVGPRPHPVALNEKFEDLVPLYNVRHRVRPGITGLAQISGFRGETDTLEKMSSRVAYDLAYIRNWSILLDIYIIVLTALGRFRDRNAY